MNSTIDIKKDSVIFKNILYKKLGLARLFLFFVILYVAFILYNMFVSRILNIDDSIVWGILVILLLVYLVISFKFSSSKKFNINDIKKIKIYKKYINAPLTQSAIFVVYLKNDNKMIIYVNNNNGIDIKDIANALSMKNILVELKIVSSWFFAFKLLF